jgi:hypothetical protein
MSYFTFGSSGPHSPSRQPGEFGPDAGEGPFREVLREALLDMVHRGDQKVPAAHGDVGHAEVEEPLGRGVTAW